MPWKRELYPDNWDEIRAHIMERAQGRCEFCGAENYQPHPITGGKVVLTCAHILNPDPMDTRDENLKMLCQKCHNTLDAPMRVQHSKATRAAKREAEVKAAGQLSLFGGEK